MMRPLMIAACLVLTTAAFRRIGPGHPPRPQAAPPRPLRRRHRNAGSGRAQGQCRQRPPADLHLPGLPRHHRLQERLSELPRAQDRRAVGGVPGQCADRIQEGHAQAPDDAGPVAELLRPGHRRHRRLPFVPEVSEPTMTNTDPRHRPCPRRARRLRPRRAAPAPTPPAEHSAADRGEGHTSSSAGLPAGHIAAGEQLASDQGQGHRPVLHRLPRRRRQRADRRDLSRSSPASTTTTSPIRCRPTATATASTR